MFILGLILFLIGLLAGIPILFWIGIVLMVIGLVFWFAPRDPTTPRRRYY